MSEKELEIVTTQKAHDHGLMIGLGLLTLFAGIICTFFVPDVPIMVAPVALLGITGATFYVTGLVLWLLTWKKK